MRYFPGYRRPYVSAITLYCMHKEILNMVCPSLPYKQAQRTQAYSSYKSKEKEIMLLGF